VFFSSHSFATFSRHSPFFRCRHHFPHSSLHAWLVFTLLYLMLFFFSSFLLLLLPFPSVLWLLFSSYSISILSLYFLSVPFILLYRVLL
jgi:hypothetical protein